MRYSTGELPNSTLGQSLRHLGCEGREGTGRSLDQESDFNFDCAVPFPFTVQPLEIQLTSLSRSFLDVSEQTCPVPSGLSLVGFHDSVTSLGSRGNSPPSFPR